MSVDVNLAAINPPISSFSRAGRMAESLGGKRMVKTEPKAPPPPKDYLKLLTAGDLGGEKGVSSSNDEEAYERGDELCSSARDHPVTVKRQTFVSAVEKEIAFKSALQQFRANDTGEVPVPRLIPAETLADKATAQAIAGNRVTSPLMAGKLGTPANQMNKSGTPVVHGGKRSPSPKKNQKRAVSPDKKFGFGGTCKIEAAKEYRVSDSTPPVGHYHPKYAVLDTHEQTAFISKARTRSPRGNAEGASTNSPNRTALGTATNKSGRQNTTAGSMGADQQSTLGGTMPLDGTLSRQLPSAGGQGQQAGGAPQAANGKQQSPVGANPQDPAKPVPKVGTSAFLSAVPKGGPTLGELSAKAGQRSKSVPLTEARVGRVNEAHFGPPPNRSSVKFDKQVSRSDREKVMSKGQAGTTDLAYYPKMKPFHSPALPFSGQVPREREEKLPRTSHNLATAQRLLPAEYNLDKTKFKRLPCTTDFKKQVSREVDINNMILVKRSQTAAWDRSEDRSGSPSGYSGYDEPSGNDSKVLPLATSASRHTPTFKMGKIPGRKQEKPKAAHDVIYTVDYSATDKKLPDTHITATPDRPKIGYQGCETLQIGVGKYNVESSQTQRKIGRAIDIGHMVSRDKREQLATGHVDKLSNAVYDADAAIKRTQEKRVPGNPFMGTHVSRQTRAQVMSKGELNPLDKTYDWSTDSSHLKKGAVEFGKQVQREKHAGSQFANAMKRELSPALHD